MKRKITIELDEATGINAAELAANCGQGFREYLAKMLEEALKERVNVTAILEHYPVTLEISEAAYEDLLYHSGDYCDMATAARYFLAEAIEKATGGKRWKRK